MAPRDERAGYVPVRVRLVRSAVTADPSVWPLQPADLLPPRREGLPVRRRAAALLVPLLLLVACGGSGDDPDTDATDAAVTAELPTVTGGFGADPTVDVPAGDAGTELVVEVLEEGDGPEVAAGEVIVADYVGQRWAPAAETPSARADPSASPDAASDVFDTTFIDGRTPVSFVVDTGSLLPGMYEGLVGQTVGSRVLLVIPPDQGFGTAGQAELGIAPEDTLIFVFDLIDSFAGDAAADGTPVDIAPDAALPTVEAGDAGPTITVPSATTAPTELVAQTLIEGGGDEVLAGQFLVVQYRGVLWKDGSEFDSSWSKGQPTGFPIGVGGVITGWDTGLVGRTVGSRVLLVVPPAEGYGAEGRPPTIAGDDTLVFVVDILGAYGDPS